jgi:hypothetical protein
MALEQSEVGWKATPAIAALKQYVNVAKSNSDP